MNTSDMKSYFLDGVNCSKKFTIGAEIETQFVDFKGWPIETEVSQSMLAWLSEQGWKVVGRKNNLITELEDEAGNKIFYELGRHNMEISTIASDKESILGITTACLAHLYKAGEEFGAFPHRNPLLNADEDLLVIPDERDAVWLKLDGRNALAPLAKTSSVQFTFSVSPDNAIRVLNNFGKNIDLFLADYPQDAVWKRYVKESSAGYRANRYGGPLYFNSIDDYCEKLCENQVVKGEKLVPYALVEQLDPSLYIRSIWWHFRLKRYGSTLCIEVRPMARRADEKIADQLALVLNIMAL